MRDRFPLMALAGLLFALGAGYLLHQAGRRGGFAEPYSTYRSAEDGSRALFLLAREAGLSVERRQIDLRGLETGPAALVLIGVDTLPDAELEQLKQFVLDGGQLVLVNGPEDKAEKRGWLSALREGRSVYDAFGIESAASAGPELERAIEAGVPSPLTRGVEALEARVAGYLTRNDKQGIASLLTDPHEDDRPVGIAFAYGEGRVVAVAAPDLATNRVLGRADNARFWLALLGSIGRGGVVEFDEFHHGFTGERSISAYAARFGLHWAVLQLLLAVWVWIAAHRRFGRPRGVGDDQRTATADYLLAMARIYRQAGHRSHAARLLFEGLTRRLARRSGLPARSSVNDLAGALDRRGRHDLARAMVSARDELAGAEASDGALLTFARRCASAHRLADARPAADATAFIQPGTPGAPPRTDAAADPRSRR